MLDGQGNRGISGDIEFKIHLYQVIVIFVDIHTKRRCVLFQIGQSEIQSHEFQKHVQGVLGKYRLEIALGTAARTHVHAKDHGHDGLRHGGFLPFCSRNRFLALFGRGKGIYLLDQIHKVDLIHFEHQVKVRDIEVKRSVGCFRAHVIDGEQFLIVTAIRKFAKVHHGYCKFAVRQIQHVIIEFQTCLHVKAVVQVNGFLGIEIHVGIVKEAAHHAGKHIAYRFFQVKFITLLGISGKIHGELHVNRLDVFIRIGFHFPVLILSFHGTARHIHYDIGKFYFKIGIVLDLHLCADHVTHFHVKESAGHVDGKVIFDQTVSHRFLRRKRNILSDIHAVLGAGTLDHDIRDGTTLQVQAVAVGIRGNGLFDLETSCRLPVGPRDGHGVLTEGKRHELGKVILAEVGS